MNMIQRFQSDHVARDRKKVPAGKRGDGRRGGSSGGAGNALSGVGKERGGAEQGGVEENPLYWEGPSGPRRPKRVVKRNRRYLDSDDDLDTDMEDLDPDLDVDLVDLTAPVAAPKKTCRTYTVGDVMCETMCGILCGIMYEAMYYEYLCCLTL